MYYDTLRLQSRFFIALGDRWHLQYLPDSSFCGTSLGTLRCSARKQSCNTKPFCSYSASIHVSVTLFTFVLPFFSSLHNTRHTRNCARQFNIGQDREAGRLVTWWMITFRQNNHPESVIPLTKKRRMTYKWRKSDLKDENWVIF